VAAALICLVVAAVSCRSVKTVTVEVPVTVHDTMYVSQQIHDSVYVENTEYVKGDTVYRYKTKYVEKVRTDTVYSYIEKPVETIKEVKTTEYVERERRWWEKTLMGLGALSLFGMFVFVASLAIKTKK
jgi:hypothetical protein